jgi:hypothetical protein
MAIKLDSISSIHLNSAFPDIVISTANESGISRILFESKLEAQDEFNSLMSSMGMSKGDEASTTKGDSQ